VETIGAKDAVLIDDEVPFATIAWRIWHIGSLCLRGYEIHFFEDVPELGDRHEWLGTPKKGVQAGRGLGALHLPYRSPRRQAPPGADRHGPVRLADETYLKLALHALKVVTRHGGYQTHPDMAGSWLSPGPRGSPRGASVGALSSWKTMPSPMTGYVGEVRGVPR